MPSTSSDRPKMECAGVPAGAKMLVEPVPKDEGTWVAMADQICRVNMTLRKHK